MDAATTAARRLALRMRFCVSRWTAGGKLDVFPDAERRRMGRESAGDRVKCRNRGSLVGYRQPLRSIPSFDTRICVVLR